MKKVGFSPEAIEEFIFWAREDSRILVKIVSLIDDIQRDPFSGLGKPEGLKHNYKGYWSRRITGKHRLIYRVTADEILIDACRFHYKK